MKIKNLDRKKKDLLVFIILGIPSFIFVIFILFSFYILFSSFFLTILIVLMLATLRKNRIYFRLTKIGIVMVIIFFVNFFNILLLPGQMARHSPGGRLKLIDPDHSEIEKIEDDFYSWHLDRYGTIFDDLSEDTWEDLELKLKRVDYYIRVYVIVWTDDMITYFSTDHVATLDEIFESDSDEDGIFEDDCDGIAVLTASLLIHMGYNAFISECLSHWNTIVFPEDSNPKTLKGFENGIHLYNSWGKPSYYIFNQTEVIIPPGRPIILSLYELFMESGTYDDFAYLFHNGFMGLPLIFTMLIVYAILLIAALVVYIGVKIGLPRSTLEKKIKRRRFFKTMLMTSLIGSFVAIIIYWFAMSGLGSLGTLIMMSTLIIVCRYDEYRITKDN